MYVCSYSTYVSNCHDIHNIILMSNPCTADPCDNYTCPTGSQCEVFEPTGEAFCDSSCDLDNGGCPANQICSLQIVQCIRAPCPTFVQCTPSESVALLSSCIVQNFDRENRKY